MTKEWTKCIDKLPPRRKWIIIKRWYSTNVIEYKKRSFFGMRWIGDAVDCEMSPNDEWKEK